ncbi:MAG: hypothetical protein JSV24_04675, partial [Bacteroidales bacterium]
MKKLTLLLIAVPSVIFAQLNEGFEGGNITEWEQSDPSRWAASSIVPITGAYSLHHIYNNTMAGHDQISIPLHNIGLDSALTTWKFNVRHGYPPSGSNNWGVFLVSDMNAHQMFPSGLANGYVLGVNYSGTDDMVKLWKVTSGAGSTILNTGFDWEGEVMTTDVIGFQVSRTTDGSWNVKIDTS